MDEGGLEECIVPPSGDKVVPSTYVRTVTASNILNGLDSAGVFAFAAGTLSRLFVSEMRLKGGGQ